MTALPNTINADPVTFIAKWQGVTASELSTSQSFLIDLCFLLGVPTPHPTAEQDYMFERPISFSHGDGRQVRAAISGLERFIVTPETAKHRVFVFLDGSIEPEHKLVVVASADAFALGVLSSAVHVVWALAAGGRLGVGNDPVYVKSRCFEPFAFPAPSAEQEESVRCAGARLDAHCKRQQAAHPTLTLTGMYNVLEKLRSGEPLSDKERVIHEQRLVSVLRQIHDELDAAVLEAYGWSDLLPLLWQAHGNDAPAEGQTREDAKRAFDEAVLERLVALNAERAAEEARGLVRWLRPEFQNPAGHAVDTPEQGELVTDRSKPMA